MTINRLRNGKEAVDSVRLLGISGSLRKESLSTALLESIELESFPHVSVSVRTLRDIPLYNEDLDTESPCRPLRDSGPMCKLAMAL